jgi:hypothetical protein
MRATQALHGPWPVGPNISDVRDTRTSDATLKSPAEVAEITARSLLAALGALLILPLVLMMTAMVALFATGPVLAVVWAVTELRPAFA